VTACNYVTVGMKSNLGRAQLAWQPNYNRLAGGAHRDQRLICCAAAAAAAAAAAGELGMVWVYSSQETAQEWRVGNGSGPLDEAGASLWLPPGEWEGCG
jgi:hypothetical protein